MPDRSLLLMITANDRAGFFYSAEEIKRYVRRRDLEEELRSEDLFDACLQRLSRAEVPAKRVLRRLIEVFDFDQRSRPFIV